MPCNCREWLLSCEGGGSAERRARQGLCSRAHSGGPHRQGEATGVVAGEELRQQGQNQVHAPAGPRHHHRQAEKEEDRRQGNRHIDLKAFF